MNTITEKKGKKPENKGFVVNMPKWPRWQVEEFCGYVPKTTFWDDFWIGLLFGGIEGVCETYDRAFKEWRGDVVYVTELAMVLNHLGDFWWERQRRVAEVFYDLYEQTDSWCREHLKGDDREYYYRVTD